MKNKTAVEWLEWEINKRGPKENNPPQWLKELYDQAKEMEHYQIIDFAEDFSMQDHCTLTAKQYYTETYGN